MFNTEIGYLPEFNQKVKDQIVYKYFPLTDKSLPMTMAALMYSRNPQFRVIVANDTSTFVQNENVYSFYFLSNFKWTPDWAADVMQFHNRYKKIKALELQEKFLSEKLHTKIGLRIAPEENTVFIFTERFTNELYHAVQFLIPKFFSIFETKPLTKEEKEFLLTLTVKDSAPYNKELTKIVRSQSFKKYLMTINVSQLEKRLFEKRIINAETELGSLEQKMKNALQMYKEACEESVIAKAALYGLKSMRDQQDEHTELQDYLINNKHISNLIVDEEMISFIVKTEFVPSHVDDWEIFSSRKEFFKGIKKGIISEEEAKLLLDAVYSEKRCLKIKMCGYFRMNYFGSFVESRRNYNYAAADPSLENYIPNPHLNMHNCLGENQTFILEQLKAGDMIGAIECATICAQRVNLHENFTFIPFLQSLLTTDKKYFVSPEGQDMDPFEAIEYLNEKHGC